MSKRKQKKLNSRQKKILQKVLTIQNSAIEHSLESMIEATKEMYALNMITEWILNDRI